MTKTQPSAVSHQPSAIGGHKPPVVVIGGGLAGLIAATRVARAGLPVVLVEKSSSLGGRAATHERSGFHFNLGPHALYRAGILRRTLKELGVDVHGCVPGSNGGFALYRGQLHTLPTGPASLLSTGVLSVAGKLEFARLQASVPRLDSKSVDGQTLTAWLSGHVRDERVKQLMLMLARVTTFTHDPDRQSAGAVIEQLQMAIKASVLYLDGGWQTIVDGLARVARDAGVRVVSGAPVVSLEQSGKGEVDGVRLADGRAIRASAAIVTGAPADVTSVTGAAWAEAPEAVRVATLDLALRSLPRPKRTVAFGVDVPLYFSVHSAAARLAPEGGALIHVSKYLQPGLSSDGVEQELEAFMDQMQPGWREQVVFRQYLPAMTVTHAELKACNGGAAGRPAPRLKGWQNVFIAGDWVGPHGQLSDAAAASATAAAELAAGIVASGFLTAVASAKAVSRTESVEAIY